MIFKEDAVFLIGKPVKCLSIGHVVNKGIMKGFTGSGSVIIYGENGTIFSSLKNVFLPESDIPDEAAMHDYVIAKYMERMGNLNALIRFPLDFDIEHDEEAREAYVRCAEKIIGIPMI